MRYRSRGRFSGRRKSYSRGSSRRRTRSFSRRRAPLRQRIGYRM